MTTSEEMRAYATKAIDFATREVAKGSKEGGRAFHQTSVIWKTSAEICERLDKIITLLEKTNAEPDRD